MADITVAERLRALAPQPQRFAKADRRAPTNLPVMPPQGVIRADFDALERE